MVSTILPRRPVADERRSGFRFRSWFTIDACTNFTTWRKMRGVQEKNTISSHEKLAFLIKVSWMTRTIAICLLRLVEITMIITATFSCFFFPEATYLCLSDVVI